MWLLFLLHFSFASTCEFPFPIRIEEKNVAACLKSQRTQKVGHLLFVHFPRAVYAPNAFSSQVQFFTNTASTRQKLCDILKMKRQISDYALADQEGSSLDYTKNGFVIEKQASTLKMLACSVL